MIKDKPLKVVHYLGVMVEKYMLRHFSKLMIVGEVQTQVDKAALVLLNHFSFNDGFVLHRLNRTIFRKRFKTMSVEAQLRAFPLLRYIGCFSVNKKSRDVIESLNYAAELLNDPANMLCIFPQGEVYSQHLPKVHFEKGLSQILKKTKQPIQVIMGVMLVDYLDNFKPVMRVYLKVYDGERNMAEMERVYNEFYTACKYQQCQLHHPPESVFKTEVKA